MEKLNIKNKRQYIKCNNETQWNSVQKYFFKRNILWITGENFIVSNPYSYPTNIILNNKECLTHHWTDSPENAIDAKIFLRQEKLKKIQ